MNGYGQIMRLINFQINTMSVISLRKNTIIKSPKNEEKLG